MSLLAFAVPIPADRMNHWRAFVDSLNGDRQAEFIASRNQAGVRERDFLQSTPQGDLLIVTLEGENPADALAEFGRQSSPFAQWCRSQVLEIHGFDMADLSGPLPELVVDTGK